MKNLTKIAALPTGGGCQSALRPEDRGAERKPAKAGAPQQLVPIMANLEFWRRQLDGLKGYGEGTC